MPINLLSVRMKSNKSRDFIPARYIQNTFAARDLTLPLEMKAECDVTAGVVAFAI